MEVLSVLPGATMANHHCELCGSNRIQWFTPEHHHRLDGIFLCLVCAKINVRCAVPDPTPFCCS